MKKSCNYFPFLSKVTMPFCVVLLLFFCSTVFAEQLHYSKNKKENVYQFNYQWLDFSGNEQHLSFDLPTEALFNRFRDFRAYRPKLAEKAILRAIRKEWNQQSIPGVVVKFPRNNTNDKIAISGRDQQKVEAAYQQLNKIEQQCRSTYFKENFYHTFTTHDHITAVKPNHVSIANVSVDDLKTIKPIILETVSIKNIRKVTNYVLAFVQSIPYSTLESRVSSSGAGFNTPLKVLWENQGDCDSKATLTVALLRALMPRIPMRLIFIEQHALIAIAIPEMADEVTIVEDGISFVLADPTGPALLPLGQLTTDTEQIILSGHYVSEAFY